MTEAEQQLCTIGNSNNEQAELLVQEEEQQTGMKYSYRIAKKFEGQNFRGIVNLSVSWIKFLGIAEVQN